MYTDDGHSVRDEEIEKYYEYLKHMATRQGYDVSDLHPESKKTKRQKRRQRPKLRVMDY